MIDLTHTCAPAIAALRAHAHHAGAEAADLQARAAAARQEAERLEALAAAAKRRYFSHLVEIDNRMGNTPSPFEALANNP